MIQRLEEQQSGDGFLWAAGRLTLWIEATSPDGYEDLLQLIQVAENTGRHVSLGLTALGEEAQRIWYLYLKDVQPHRAVARLYEALSTLAAGSKHGFAESSATALFMAASSDSYTEDLLREMNESYRKLVT